MNCISQYPLHLGVAIKRKKLGEISGKLLLKKKKSWLSLEVSRICPHSFSPSFLDLRCDGWCSCSIFWTMRQFWRCKTLKMTEKKDRGSLETTNLELPISRFLHFSETSKPYIKPPFLFCLFLQLKLILTITILRLFDLPLSWWFFFITVTTTWHYYWSVSPIRM